MARGFLSGVIMGTLVVAGGAAGVSLYVGPPEGVRPVAVAPEGAPLEENTPAPAPEIGGEMAGEELAGLQPPTTGEAETAPMQAPETETALKPVPVLPETEAETPLETDTVSAVPIETPPEELRESQTAQEPAPDATGATDAQTQEAEPAPVTAPVTAEPTPDPVPDAEREEITLQIEPEAETPAEESDRASIGTPAKTLASSSSSRLPSVASEAEVTTPETAMNAAGANAPPFVKYAAPFEGDASKPKMAIVLIDDGTSNIGVEALTTFPYPLSFAVDTSWEGAKDAMAVYRSSGFEVLAMVDLPRGARASDVEVSLPLLMAEVPEAVGVIETPDAGLQESRDVSEQITEMLSDTGHGLLLFPKGLNTARKLAAKEGVPSATVFRDFDGKGQNASSIKRFLSHAALKAGTEGGVVMVGRLRADTISALLLWGLQDRSEQLALAPVSQLLKTAE